MKKALVLAAALAVLVSAGSASPRATGCGQLLLRPRATQAGDTTLFGHVSSLKRNGARFELRFDPALWLTGVTASRASLEDTGSGDVPNDYFIRDPDHKLLSFHVPATTPVTDLVRGSCLRHTTVAALARSSERAQVSFWIRVHNDTIRSLDQQFRP